MLLLLNCISTSAVLNERVKGLDLKLCKPSYNNIKYCYNINVNASTSYIIIHLRKMVISVIMRHMRMSLYLC